MENKRPLILISNDDGYHANGIKTLVNILKEEADLLVCAPESARSGFATAFTAAEPLRLKRRRNMGEVEVWSCNGTPVDCVKLAIDQFCQERMPDLILGGINHGQFHGQYPLFRNDGRSHGGLHEIYPLHRLFQL